MKNIIKEIDKEYGHYKIRYSIIVFGDPPSVKVQFNEKFSTDFGLDRLLDTLRPPPGGAALDKALDEARKQFESHARPNAKKVLVVMIDRKSTSSPVDVKLKAKPFEHTGVHVIAISVGNETDPKELGEITPSKRNLIIANKTDTPKRLSEEIIDKVLEGE